MEDSAILECFRTGVGEKDAFESLFRKYYPQMCVYAHRYVDMTETEDIVQECFVWIWNNRSVIVVGKSVPNYLFSMVRHRALNNIRKRNIGQKVVDLLYESGKDEIEENAFNAEDLKKRIQEAIESLPEPFREAFTLHRFSDKTYDRRLPDTAGAEDSAHETQRLSPCRPAGRSHENSCKSINSANLRGKAPRSGLLQG